MKHFVFSLLTAISPIASYAQSMEGKGLASFENNAHAIEQPQSLQPASTYRAMLQQSGLSLLMPEAGAAAPIMPVYEYSQGGAIIENKGFVMTGYSAHSEYVGMMSVQSAALQLSKDYGNLSLDATLYANRYLTYGVSTQYGLSASATYRFSPNVSATVFGSYYSTNPYFSMAAFPYVPTSSYGGFFTFRNDRVALDLGAERRYDPFARRWQTVPIITPSIKISKRVTIELPLGDLTKKTLEHIFNKGHNNGPIIMPEL